MASALASQLQALAVAGGGPTYVKPSTRPSLLFHPSKAADIDIQTILSISRSALEVLSSEHRGFKQFLHTLFSLESTQTDRELQSKDFNDDLNKSITTFLRMLSGYAMLTAAHEVLEYLIRRHKVYVYNVEAVVLCLLPYHETSLFVRVVQLLQLTGTRWDFLEAVQKTGAPLSRHVLVQRCTNDMAVLESIFEEAKAMANMQVLRKTTLSFATVVLVETLAEVRVVSTDLVNRILPFILNGLHKKATEEYRVGALMVIGALANRATLAPSLLNAFLQSIPHVYDKNSMKETLSVLQLRVMVLIQLVQTQEIMKLSSEALLKFQGRSDFVPMLAEMVTVYNAEKFLKLYMQALVEKCLQNDGCEASILEAMKSLPVANEVVPSVLSLLEMAFGKQPKERSVEKAAQSRELVGRLLEAFGERFPAEVDKAVALQLKKSKKAYQGNEKDDPVYIFISDVFQGSVRAPLAETRMSLYLSLDDSQASNREAAVRQLSNLAPAEGSSEIAEAHAVMREAYLRRLSDEDHRVIRAVLSADQLVTIVPPERLFQALASVLSRCKTSLMAGEKSSKKDGEATCKMVIDLLASKFLAERPSYVEQVAVLLFEYLLYRSKTWRLNKLILKAASTIPFHLFTGLVSVLDETPSSADEGTRSKEKLKLWEAAVNGRIIRFLVVKVSDDPSTWVRLFLKSNLGDDSKLLTALVILQYFRERSAESNSLLRDAGLQWLSNEWAIEGYRKSLPLSVMESIEYSSWDEVQCAPPQFFRKLVVDSKIAYAELLLRALHTLLTILSNYSSMDRQTGGGNGAWDALYVLFFGFPTMKVFQAHIEILLSRLQTADTIPFLTKFFTTEGAVAPAFVQVHTLAVLSAQILSIAQLKSISVATYSFLQSALPPLIVALADPLKVVRKSASTCVEHLCTAWDKHSSDKGKGNMKPPFLNARCFGRLLKVLVGAKATVISTEGYLPELLKAKYGATSESDDGKTSEADEVQSVITFFVTHAFQLAIHGEQVVYEMLQGMARSFELVSATQERRRGLVERRQLAHLQSSAEKPQETLSQAEVQLLELLCQMFTTNLSAESSRFPDADVDILYSTFFECLTVDGGSLADPAVMQPCLAALKCLTPDFYSGLGTRWQDVAFQCLISLSSAGNEAARSKAHEDLKVIKIHVSTITRHLELLLEGGMAGGYTPKKKKKRKTTEEERVGASSKWPTRDKLLTSSSTILELLIWKTDLEDRHALVAPLFQLLRGIVSGAWPHFLSDQDSLMEEDALEGGLPSNATAVLNLQQLIFMVLENLVKSMTELGDQKVSVTQTDFDVDTIVMAVNKATDGMTRNHALALLTCVGKLIPDAVLHHVTDILTVIGESTLTKDDPYSHQVVYHLLMATVPGWMAVEKDPTALLQVFVNTLPRIPVHRRMTVITNLLRVTTEEVGLHLFVFLCLQKARSATPSPKRTTANGVSEENSEAAESLEMNFAASLCRHYSLSIKLPALEKLLDISKVGRHPLNVPALPDSLPEGSEWALQQLATQFVADQLQDPESQNDVELADSSSRLQNTFVALMEKALSQFNNVRQHGVPPSLEKGVRESAFSLLDGLTRVMPSASYLEGISAMIKHPDANTRRRVLRMYTSKLKEHDTVVVQLGKAKKKKRAAAASSKGVLRLTAEETTLRTRMLQNVTALVAGEAKDNNLGSWLAAIEALKVSAEKFAIEMPEDFIPSLAALVERFALSDRDVCTAAVQCATTILERLGPRALPALPDTMSALFKILEESLKMPLGGTEVEDEGEGSINPPPKELGLQSSQLVVSVLEALEAVLDKMGAFLTPYLQKIVGLVLLQPLLIANSKTDISTRAGAIRTLLPERITARLLLDPLLSTYESAIEAGVDSASALFDMLAAMSAKADRSSVGAYYGRIFEFCLKAFDLRRSRSLGALQSVSRVETAVVNALVSLVMKLSETTFKPLFVKFLDWAESETEGKDGTFARQNVNRNIVFYKLVNQLTTKLRSVFVPYFQYFINGCVHHLTGGELKPDTSITPAKKKKKRSAATDEEQKPTLSSSEWQLRQLIVSSLHQCFLFDTISFLDAQRFELLLPPLVAQLVVEPPSEVPVLQQDAGGASVDLPSLQETDEVLVSCLGQMALTAGTDLLWKPLNHEVLMCTRVENSRTRLLGLRVVKFLAERLREEYLVLVPETIPFLAELLEDTDLSVVAKTQEVVKFLEELSGEDLTQYF